MEHTLHLTSIADRTSVTGPGERYLKMVRDALNVRIASRDQDISIQGDELDVLRAVDVLEQLRQAAQRKKPMNTTMLLEVLSQVSKKTEAELTPWQDTPATRQLRADKLEVYLPGRTVRPASQGQHAYIKSILNHDLTFCTGPAGTGKTYLAVAAAAAMLKRNQVRKLVLCRPAVEAGEKIGFLPGTMQDKVNPYLRPLLDALHDMMDYENVQRLMAVDVIEIVPLAFMRGRTLNDAMIILDEAQNTTRAQMLMFLTRLGHGSKMVVTGDTSQIDLDHPNDSGLLDAIRRLRRVKEVAMTTLDKQDIVRHQLVQHIVHAYESASSAQTAQSQPGNAPIPAEDHLK